MATLATAKPVVPAYHRPVVRSISAPELLERLDAGDDVDLLDVREPDEFAAWRIPTARNVPVGQLAARLAEVPEDRDVIAVCAKGSRATTAAELLERAGRRVAVLQGGMDAWSRVYDDAVLELGAAEVVQVRRRGKGCLSYLVGAGGRALVVDPSSDVHEYVDRASARGWTITDVVDTHLHADHVSGARALAARTGAVLRLSPLDAFGFDFVPLHDGDLLALGDDVVLEVGVRGTPGHTRGSTTLVLGDDAVLTGDVLFLESVGRPDLADQAEQFARSLYASLHDCILALPHEALVLPAHVGEAVTVTKAPVAASIATLLAGLWQLSASEAEFVRWAVASVTERPPNYRTIVEANRTGVVLSADDRCGLEAGPNRCAVAS